MASMFSPKKIRKLVTINRLANWTTKIASMRYQVRVPVPGTCRQEAMILPDTPQYGEYPGSTSYGMSGVKQPLSY